MEACGDRSRLPAEPLNDLKLTSETSFAISDDVYRFVSITPQRVADFADNNVELLPKPTVRIRRQADAFDASRVFVSQATCTPVLRAQGAKSEGC